MESRYRKYNLKAVFPFGCERPQVPDIAERQLGLREYEVNGLQYPFLGNSLYVSVKNDEVCHRVMQKTEGSANFRTAKGEILNDGIIYAGLGLRTVLIFNLPFGMEFEHIKRTFEAFGTLIQIHGEKWRKISKN